MGRSLFINSFVNNLGVYKNLSTWLDTSGCYNEKYTPVFVESYTHEPRQQKNEENKFQTI